LGLLLAGIPSINSLSSLWLCQEKPVIYTKLQHVQRLLANTDNAFPLIPQSYYGNHRSMSFVNWSRAVVKIGTAHSGLGKLRVNNMDEFQDVRSVCALQPRYILAYHINAMHINM
jgi:hypothetical protein